MPVKRESSKHTRHGPLPKGTRISAVKLGSKTAVILRAIHYLPDKSPKEIQKILANPQMAPEPLKRFLPPEGVKVSFASIFKWCRELNPEPSNTTQCIRALAILRGVKGKSVVECNRVLKEVGIRLSLKGVSNILKSIPRFEKEGLWTPLEIKDVNSFLTEIKRPDYPENQADIFDGVVRSAIMISFFDLIGGKIENNVCRASVRFVDSPQFILKVKSRFEFNIRTILDAINDLILMGILRRCSANSRILMIPTKQQSLEIERQARDNVELLSNLETESKGII